MMKKNFILPLLAAASLSSVAQGALSDDQGNWSIVLNLNTKEVYNLIQDEPDRNIFGDISVFANPEGVNLVSWNGDADYAYNNGESFGSVTDRQASYWLGWGRGYFNTPPAQAATGMPNGLQMGFFEGANATVDKPANLDSQYRGTGYSNAGYYRGHTKEDIDFDFIQDSDEGASVMDNLKDFTSIDSATLVLVHNNNNGAVEDGGNGYSEHGNGKAHSQTLQYLTVTGRDKNGEKYTITYIAEVDDSGSTNPADPLDGSYYPGSNRYDVDILKGVQVNDKYVDSFLVSSDALTSEQVKDLVINGVIPNVTFTIPEPASATLSMMALTALCARRRRRK